MTLKQYALREFFAALDAYKLALQTKTGLVAASIRISAARGQVPRHYGRLVSAAFNAV